MDFKNLLKRVFPFFATFAVGLFVASFFVTVGFPSFERRGNRKHREFHQMKYENQQLRQDNCRMRKQMAEIERQRLELEVPPPSMPMKTVELKEKK